MCGVEAKLSGHLFPWSSKNNVWQSCGKRFPDRHHDHQSLRAETADARATEFPALPAPAL